LEQARTVEDRETLGTSIVGGEAKPLPYLLSQMNLLLHGVEYPRISTGNSLATRIAEIGERDRVDVILTNPPFGGEEEAGIRDNFPPDRRTSETALLFLQLIMRKLRRNPRQGYGPARAGVVVPNGTLFGDGVAGRIKQELLTEFNLHTIVRLPGGVFAPYTPIPTNVLFFERSGAPTKDTWYYELPAPEGRRQYTKTSPIRSDDFVDCLAWWKDRRPSPRAWSVSAEELIESNCNLDLRNPHVSAHEEPLTARELANRVIEQEQIVLTLLEEVRRMLVEVDA
jgi:type I restriction enzyme M protein